MHRDNWNQQQCWGRFRKDIARIKTVLKEKEAAS